MCIRDRQKLMALNISLGNAKRAQLRTVMIAALTIIIIVIAVSVSYTHLDVYKRQV